MSNKLKKKIENSYEQEYGNHGIDINDIKSRLMFKEQNTKKGEKIFMSKNVNKKSHWASWLVLTCLVVALTLAVIFIPKTVKKQEKGDYKDQIVTINTNPSTPETVHTSSRRMAKMETFDSKTGTYEVGVSFATDEKGIVVAVYGNNDEGKMVIEGEELTGITLEAAIDKLFDIEIKCGYIVKSDDPEYNKIEINVSAEVAPELQDKVEKLKNEVVQSLDELGVQVKDKVAAAYETAHEALVNEACALDPTLNNAEVNELSDDKIIALISAYYLEASKFPTAELEGLYNQFKENEIKIAGTEAITKIEGGLLTLNAVIQKEYNRYYELAQNALVAFEEAYNKHFVASDSAYQVAYTKVKEAKAEVLKLRAEVANMEDSAEKTMKEALLSAAEATLLTAQGLLEKAKEVAYNLVNAAKIAVNTCFENIQKYILSEKDLKELMTKKEQEVEDYLNTTKDKMFENFEAKYADQIAEFARNVANQKTTLINNLKDYASAK